MCVEDGKKLYEAELKIYFSLMFFSLSKYKETYIYYYNRVVIYMIGNDSNNLSCMDIINNFNDLTFSIVPVSNHSPELNAPRGALYFVKPLNKLFNSNHSGRPIYVFANTVASVPITAGVVG